MQSRIPIWSGPAKLWSAILMPCQFLVIVSPLSYDRGVRLSCNEPAHEQQPCIAQGDVELRRYCNLHPGAALLRPRSAGAAGPVAGAQPDYRAADPRHHQDRPGSIARHADSGSAERRLHRRRLHHAGIADRRRDRRPAAVPRRHPGQARQGQGTDRAPVCQDRSRTARGCASLAWRRHRGATCRNCAGRRPRQTDPGRDPHSPVVHHPDDHAFAGPGFRPDRQSRPRSGAAGVHFARARVAARSRCPPGRQRRSRADHAGAGRCDGGRFPLLLFAVSRQCHLRHRRRGRAVGADVPHAALFGALSGLLRFVPYLGALAAGAAIAIFVAAIDPGWALPLPAWPCSSCSN